MQRDKKKKRKFMDDLTSSGFARKLPVARDRALSKTLIFEIPYSPLTSLHGVVLQT